MPNDKTTVMLPKNKRNNQQQNQRANSNDSNDSKPRIPRTPKNIRNDETIIAKNNRTGKYRNSQNTSTKYSPKNSPKNDKIVPDYSLTDDEYYDDYQYDNIYEAVLSSPLLRDFIGVLFIIFSIILISATWFNASGSVLNFFEFITRFFVGNFAFAMPIFLVYLSYRIMSKRWDLYENLRALGGVMLFIISIDSYIQIGSKLPTIKNNGLETLQYHGGGLFGFIVANPLAAGVTAPVAAIIITVLLIFSLLIFTGKTFVEIWISFTELLNHLRRDEFDTGLLDGEDDGYSSGDDHSIIPSAGTNKFSKTNSDDIFPAGISTDADFNNAKIDKHGQKTSLIVGKLSDVAGGIVTKIKLKNLTDDNAISLPDSLENMSDSGDLIYTESDISTSGKLIKKSKGKHVKDGLFGYNSKNQEEADPDDLIETDRILIEGVNTSFVSNESDPYFPKDIAQPIEIGGVKTLKYGDYLDNYDPEKKKQKLAEVIVKNNKNTGLNTFSFDDENPENLDENIADDPEKTVAYKPDFVQDVNANNTVPNSIEKSGEASETGDAIMITDGEITKNHKAQNADSEPNPTEYKENWSKYKLPSLDILTPGVPLEEDKEAVEYYKNAIDDVFEQFDVDAGVTGYTQGPTVTRYEVQIGQGVKVSKVTQLENDIKYAVGNENIVILNPIPGKSAIGIEVPNKNREIVKVGDVLRSNMAKKRGSQVLVSLGKDIDGTFVLSELTKMPHLLVAGTTGSGKSSFINSLLTSIILRNRPDEVKLILVDPKRVELSAYEDLPHLLAPIVTDPKLAARTLEWLVAEMDNRYTDFEKYGFKHIDQFNKKAKAGEVINSDGRKIDPLPYIVLVVDELADLMLIAAKEVEASIQRITQLARAAGIHVVLATQRPSVKVLTGVIKGNIPARLAFATASQIDSRVILDNGGAEKLIGNGDALFLSPTAPKPVRIQSSWVNDSEVAEIVEWCKQFGKPAFREDLKFMQKVGDGPSIHNSVALGSADFAEGTGLYGNGGQGVQSQIHLPKNNGENNKYNDGAKSAGGSGSSYGELLDGKISWNGSDGDGSPLDGSPLPIKYKDGEESFETFYNWVGKDQYETFLGTVEMVINTQNGSASNAQRKMRIGFSTAGRFMDLMEQYGIVGEQKTAKAREVLAPQASLEAILDILRGKSEMSIDDAIYEGRAEENNL